MRVNFNHNNGMLWALFVLTLGIFSPFNAYASSTAAVTLDLTQHWVGQLQLRCRTHHSVMFIGS